MLQRLIAFALTWTIAAIAGAQTVDYGIRKPTPEAVTAAGIGTFHPIRESEIVSVDVFGVDENLLASCVIEWPDHSTVATCTMADKASYRQTLLWDEKRAEFEDLATGDHVSTYYEYDQPILGDVIVGQADETLSEPTGRWVYEGTKSQEEVERDWKGAALIISHTAMEVEIALGIMAERIALVRRQTEPMQDVILCPGGSAYCDSNSRSFGLGDAFGFSNCCAIASARADLACVLHTGQACCANSFCGGGCNIINYCSCYLDGWEWRCASPC